MTTSTEEDVTESTDALEDDASADQQPEGGRYDAEVVRFFDPSGPFARVIGDYRMRPLQVEMAQAIARAIEQNDVLVAEAGTGTGKTFAYLVPALLWGGKVIISTGTKNLQDQLFGRDVPTVRKALNAPVTVALLKGRSNYVCHLHLERTLEQGRMTSRADVSYLRKIAQFAKASQTGDRADLADVPENAPVWNLVTSTRDNCPGAECAYHADCFVSKARQKAQQADVVVVNHHLFFADIALKDSGVAELLPTANTVIFDEAHQLPDTATLFFGELVSTSHVFDLCRETVVEGLAHARDAADWTALVSRVEKAARDMRLAFKDDYLKISAKALAADHVLFERLDGFLAEFGKLQAVLEQQAVRSEMMALCHKRADELGGQYQAWLKAAKGEADAEFVLWVEAFGNSLQLHRTPLSISSIFTRQREDGPPRSWIFTSATLAIRENFHYFASQLGLETAPAQTWPSPFDYAEQGLLYVPDFLPQPNSPQFTDAVVDAVLPLIEAAGGRTFILCTTLRAVDRVAALLKDVFAERKWPFPLFVQGESSRTDLLDRFRAAGNGVLVGSQSFWEGVDVRGDALSLVVVDKLPFAPPDDPVLAARIATLEKEGGNGFMDYQLPEAIMSLKQGAGRLIRDESDRGVLMICDDRIVTKGYGRRIWQSLPPFARTRQQSIAEAFFSALPHNQPD